MPRTIRTGAAADSAEKKRRRGIALRRGLRALHRWLGLLVVLQLLAWVAGGLTMALLDIDRVRGAHLAAPAVPADLRGAGALVAVDEVLAGVDQPVHGLSLQSLLGRPVWRLNTAAGSLLLDAADGARLDPLDRRTAVAIARADFTGQAGPVQAHWISEPNTEIRGRELPLWRVDMGDELATSIYVSPRTGEVVARRNRLWRVFDFVWMLHIMDYRQREDFNHPLLVATAATALAFVLTGLAMLAVSLRR